MARIFLTVGFEAQVEDRAGSYSSHFIDRPYKADLLQETDRWQQGDQIHDELTVTNRLSLVADDFAFKQIYLIRYAEMDGVRWRVSSVEVKRPRIILNLGGVFNG